MGDIPYKIMIFVNNCLIDFRFRQRARRLHLARRSLSTVTDQDYVPYQFPEIHNNTYKMNKLVQLSKIAVAALAVAGSAAQAGIINGGFETGNLSGWTTLGNVEVSTGVDYGVGSVNPFAGNYSALLNTNNVAASDLAAAMGISEAALEASNPGIDATNGSLIYQTTFASAGTAFQFKWNFVEQDYVPYDDWAFYGISFNGGPAVVTKFASLATVGPGSGTTINGWQNLFVNTTVDGNYTFFFGVVNGADTLLDSRLWIDGVTSTAPTGGTGLSVPDEGSSVALLGLALLGFVAVRRKFVRA